MTRILTLLAIATFFISAPASAQEFTPEQQEKIQSMFKDYLMENGGVILESVNKHQAEMVELEQAEANKKAAGYTDSLLKRDELATAGNPDGDVTIIEFFDYNCGYCSRALDAIQTVLKEDDNVKVIFMDMPILGESSLEASKWSLAAEKQGKYWEYHQLIMDHKGQKDEAALEKIAKEIGLDVEKLKEDKNSQEIANRLEQNIKEAESLNIRGTPGFIIEGDITPGFIPAEEIKRIIEEKRSAKS